MTSCDSLIYDRSSCEVIKRDEIESEKVTDSNSYNRYAEGA